MARTLSKNANPRILAAQFRIEHHDAFNLKELYFMMHEWIKEHQWLDIQDNTEGDHHESFFYQKTEPNDVKENWIWWRVWQFPDYSFSNSFYKFHMDIDMHTSHIHDMEAMIDGKKIKTNSGFIEIKIWAWIEVDYTGQWSNHPILKFFLEIFRLRIFERDLDRHKHELYREAFRFQETIKKFLKLPTNLPIMDREQFHPSRGVAEGGGHH